ncbi:MAG: type II toxin-antitoxin system RelE/ParE family toxin [Desulfobulbaceae bacterium]|nr:type II toxin-antitoxin system RelE/ParE family toxin [Desulfobulbaceae bacterium]
MAWEILVTDEYEQWFLDLNDEEQVDVQAMVEVLEIFGPELSRPYADTLHGTGKVKNLKELRIQHDGKPYRVFYAFDPVRRAVLLCGGRKDGAQGKRFYKKMIPIAEREFLAHLESEGFKK